MMSELLGQQQLELGRLLALTDLMSENARNGKWEVVIEIQPQRDRLIAEFFSGVLSIEENVLRESIRHILDADQAIMALGNEHRNSLKHEIKKMSQGKSAVKAYLSS